MDRLVRDDRKATVTQITTRYNQSMQNTISEHTTPEYCCWPCPSLYDYSVPIFWCYFQQDNAPRHKAQIISDWFLEHDDEFTLLKWPPQSPDLNLIEHLWDVVEREIYIMDVQPTNLQQLRDAIMSIWTKISEECFQHLHSKKNILQDLFKHDYVRFPTYTIAFWVLLNLCHEELRQFWRQKGVQPGTGTVYLIKWPVSVYIYTVDK